MESKKYNLSVIKRRYKTLWLLGIVLLAALFGSPLLLHGPERKRAAEFTDAFAQKILGVFICIWEKHKTIRDVGMPQQDQQAIEREAKQFEAYNPSEIQQRIGKVEKGLTDLIASLEVSEEKLPDNHPQKGRLKRRKDDKLDFIAQRKMYNRIRIPLNEIPSSVIKMMGLPAFVCFILSLALLFSDKISISFIPGLIIGIVS